MKILFKITYGLMLFILLISGCDNENHIKPKCPGFDWVPSTPYDDPIWHPSGTIIGFNHRPIKEIKYSYGYECPRQATYIYEEDSIGFWLINADGTNMRRVLPYYLETPDWSPDGNWIAFSNGAQISKMPFDGESFDTVAIEQLTFEGRNFFPAWSPDGELIAYDNTDCGSATTPIPPNSCGVLIMNADGSEKRYIGDGRYPYWQNTNDYLFSGGFKYDLIENTSEIFFDAWDFNVSIEPPVRFNPLGTLIAWPGNFTNTPTQFDKLLAITPNGTNLKTISDNNIINFSWAPDGRIVYVDFDNIRIDSEKGALWIMDADGRNQQQLTYNNFITSY
jgi:hypothetical protein